MSSEASGSKFMDGLALENACLKDENAELCKMIASMEEKPELHLNLKDNHGRAPRTPGKASKEASGSKFMDGLALENACLKDENAELCKMIASMENPELHLNLKDNHERAPRTPGKASKEASGSKFMDGLALENACLKDENAELCKMIASMENPELHLNLKDNHERAPRTPGKASKDPTKIQQCHKIVGEIAFQLDRRILCAVFLGERRLYGYRVAGIDEKIERITTCPLTGNVDDERRSRLNLRYHLTMDQLKELGYDPSLHPKFTEQLVNTYGVMNEQANGAGKRYKVTDVQFLSKLVAEYMPDEKVKDIVVILYCLAHLVKQDGGGMFLW